MFSSCNTCLTTCHIKWVPWPNMSSTWPNLSFSKIPEVFYLTNKYTLLFNIDFLKREKLQSVNLSQGFCNGSSLPKVHQIEDYWISSKYKPTKRRLLYCFFIHAKRLNLTIYFHWQLCVLSDYLMFCQRKCLWYNGRNYHLDDSRSTLKCKE